jgi:uracil-DNA glycosylase
MTTISRTWTENVPFLRSTAFETLLTDVAAIRRRCTVYPPESDQFRALELTSFHETRVVILGQDPYHGPGQAHGLAFSVPEGITPPPSLKNILKEVRRDQGLDPDTPLPTDLTHWATQGVLLLNTILTVERGRPGSHRNLGWQDMTEAVIEALNRDRKGLVFLLWGGHAQELGKSINTERHALFCAPHPSPLSAYRGFHGCRHFSRANAALKLFGRPPISWVPGT